jgi:uncharacterized membrane protein YphA (DoxX/SURF4 family)
MEDTLDNQNNQSKTRKNLIWILRIFLGGMFIFSAYSKIYPSVNLGLSTFEAKQLVPMGFNCYWAAWFSRTIIGGELALGILLFLPFYFRKLIIPASIALLLLFTGYLGYTYATVGNEANCGCFGTLMPFSTFESIIKNVVFIGLLVWLWRLTRHIPDVKSIWHVTTVVFGSIMLIFMLGLKCCSGSGSTVVEVEEDTTEIVEVDAPIIDTVKTPVINGKTPVDSVKVKVEVKDEPKQKSSGFKAQFADIDKGKKILCFFAPGCDHCREAAKELTQMKATIKDFPEVRIIFMDEEAELIPDFFTYAGRKYTHQVMDIGKFWNTLGMGKDTPGVFYIWNGNIIKVYDGIDAKKFNAAEFKKLVQKKYSEIK